MPQIIPIRDLKNTSEISDRCHATTEPIFVTKNGYGDMVLMSMETYEAKMQMLEIHSFSQAFRSNCRGEPSQMGVWRLVFFLSNGTIEIRFRIRRECYETTRANGSTDYCLYRVAFSGGTVSGDR